MRSLTGNSDAADSGRPLRPNWIAGDADHPFRRYTFRFEWWPRTSHPKPFEETSVRAVTAGGEHKAATMAASRLRHLQGDIVIWTVELIQVEHEWTSDPENDAIDYWEVA